MRYHIVNKLQPGLQISDTVTETFVHGLNSGDYMYYNAVPNGGNSFGAPGRMRCSRPVK